MSVLADIKSQNKVKEVKIKPSKNKPMICMLGLNHSQPIKNNTLYVAKFSENIPSSTK